MKHSSSKLLLASASSLLLVLPVSGNAAQNLAEAFSDGKAYADFRLRSESVDQDTDARKKATALTLRSRLGFKTAAIQGFSGALEFEHSRALTEDYDDVIGGDQTYSVIADPETTELDQAYIAYNNDDVSAKFGRQVITMGNHRFVGHVGWRQDRQVFDAFTAKFTPFENFAFDYGFISKRNRIFADQRDIASRDHLFNLTYKTPLGKVTGYAYLLEDEGADSTLDTVGISFGGKYKADKLSYLYAVEGASQTAEAGAGDADATYVMIEGGVALSLVTIKLGYESLGSDEGTYGFSTPLATLHKFNGWADQFLGTPAVGLNDAYVSLSGKVLGGKWVLAYHDYSSDYSDSGIDDLGNEINALFARKFMKNYFAGIKLANYSAGDDAAGKVDAQKLWVWAGASF